MNVTVWGVACQAITRATRLLTVRLCEFVLRPFMMLSASSLMTGSLDIIANWARTRRRHGCSSILRRPPAAVAHRHHELAAPLCHGAVVVGVAHDHRDRLQRTHPHLPRVRFVEQHVDGRVRPAVVVDDLHRAWP